MAVLLRRDGPIDERRLFEVRVLLTSALVAELHENDVDLVLLHEAPPHLARRVVTRGRMLFCLDPEAERDFARDVQLRAADLQPFLRRARETKPRAILR